MSETPASPGVATETALAPPAAAAPAGAPGGSRGVALGWLLAFALAALAIVGWQWYDTRVQAAALKDELARRLAEGEARNKEALGTAQDASKLVRELEAKVETLEGGLAESQNQQVALEALYQQLSRNSDEWALAEIEQTLTIAAQQLQLAGNVKAAILALQNADIRLQRIDRPQLAPLRKVIERDIERLRVSPFVDVAGVALKIDNLMEAVEVLPLAMQQRPPPQSAAPASAEDAGNIVARLAREIWQDLRSLVRIQTLDQAEVPLVDPGQAFFLRENLKLRLLSARIALLQRDAKSYRSDLQAARQWLERFYDTRDPNLAAALAMLRQLAETDVAIALPDINASLSAVRDYKLTREKSQR
ncbi:MAG: uroporphyrinogen-III C-methyltransferase [Burkholderiales bacterium]|nr:uroporphyrinogen-III C-methyltransferase [Burkholderiales bacterium]